MPDGKTHAAATVLAAGVVGPVAYFFGNASIETSIALSAGTMAGLLLSPDLDVRIGSRSFWLVRHSFGPLVGFFWQWFWQPYARLIPRHRHPLSHFPLIGTALRLLYLFLVFGGLYWAFRELWIYAGSVGSGAGLMLVDQLGRSLPPPPSLSSLLTWPYFWWAGAGLAIADGLHTLMDYTWPFQ